MATNYEQHLDQVCYVASQGTYETETNAIGATNGVMFRSLEINPGEFREPYQDHIGKLAKEGTLVKPIPVEWTARGFIRPYGSAGGSANDALFHRTGIWHHSATIQSATQTIGNAGQANAIIYVSNASGFDTNVMVGVSQLSGNGMEVRMVTAKSTAASATLTLDPPLTFSCTTSNMNIRTTVTHHLTTSATEKSMMLEKGTTHGAKKTGGAVTTGETVTWGDTAPECEYTGFGRTYRQCRTTELSSALGSSDTSMKILASNGVTPNIQMQIYSGETGKEKLTLTNRTSAGVYTVTRSSTPADNWASGKSIRPYLPTPTINGVPVPPTKCTITLELPGGSTKLKSTSGTLTINGGISPHERQSGDEWATHGFNYSDDLEVSFEAAVIMEKDRWNEWGLAGGMEGEYEIAETEMACVIQLGDRPGKTRTYYMPRAVLDPVQMESDGDGTIAATVSGKARGSRSGSQDVIYVADS